MNINEIISFIRKQEVVILGSLDENGQPSQKALFTPRVTEGNTVFYFSTNTSSQHIQQLMQDPRASLYFFEKKTVSCTGVLLKGRAEVLEDAASKEMLWHPGDELYYPLGVTDPDYCVLKVTAAEGRWYSNLGKGDFILPSGKD